MLHHTDKPRLTSSQLWAVLSQYSARFFSHKLTETLQCGINRFKLFCAKTFRYHHGAAVSRVAHYLNLSLYKRSPCFMWISLWTRQPNTGNHIWTFWKEKKEGEEADLIQQWQIKLAKNAEPPKLANTHIHTHTENSKGAAGDETIKLETVKKDGAIMSDPEPCGQPSACVNPITHLIPALRHILHFKIPINPHGDGIPKSSLNWALGK